MKPKTVVLMGVAIVCGLIAAFLVSMATATNKGPEMVQVLVADQELRQGTVITDVKKMFVGREMPRDAVPVNALTEEKQLEGMQILRTLDKGAVPTQGAVGKYEGLDKQLPPGHRAMTIRVSMDSAVAGFILPGARVDLLATMQDIRNSKLKLSKIFMQNMLVLAMNTQDVRDEKGRTVGNPTTATLAVTPAQAERLTRVVSEGTVWLVLRKPDDDKVVKTKGNINPFEDEKGDGTEADVELLVAAKDIAPNTAITDENFDEFFTKMKFPAATKPAKAVDEKEIKAAKFIYTMLGQGVPVTRLNITKPQAAVTGTGNNTEPVIPSVPSMIVQRIHNGGLPVIEVTYRDNKDGTVTGGGQNPPAGAGSEGKAPGSEGK